jgi:hypothetical protein
MARRQKKQRFGESREDWSLMQGERSAEIALTQAEIGNCERAINALIDSASALSASVSSGSADRFVKRGSANRTFRQAKATIFTACLRRGR